MPVRLIPRERRFYALFDQHIATTVDAATLLAKVLRHVPSLVEEHAAIRGYEHQGDEIMHEIVQTLNRSFITPFDREDIYALASGLDDVLDYIEEIADVVVLYRITVIPAAAVEMGELIAQATEQLRKALEKLEIRKGVDKYGIEVHRLENLGDTISRRAIGELFSGEHDPIEVIKLKEFYALLESALDRCEDVANVIESITIRNA